MASERQISVGGVPIGGGAPVAVQSMTLTETSDVAATLAQIGRLAEAGLRDRPGGGARAAPTPTRCRRSSPARRCR